MKTIIPASAVFVLMVIVGLGISPFLPPLSAQQVAGGELDGFAFEAITVSTVAIGPTAATVNPTNAPGAKALFCTVESQPIRYRFDGTAPTSSVGHPALAGATIVLVGANSITHLKAIRSGGTDATLSCTYSR